MRTVNGLEEARAALAAGERQLASPAYAACHAGIGYYEALLKALREEAPDVTLQLCCGDDAAIAHEALRRGFRQVRCRCDAAAFAKLTAIAQAQGAVLVRD